MIEFKSRCPPAQLAESDIPFPISSITRAGRQESRPAVCERLEIGTQHVSNRFTGASLLPKSRSAVVLGTLLRILIIEHATGYRRAIDVFVTSRSRIAGLSPTARLQSPKLAPLHSTA